MDGSISEIHGHLLRTVECGSFTKAAEQLSYSPSQGSAEWINDTGKGMEGSSA